MINVTDWMSLCLNIFDGICIVGMIVLVFLECFRYSMRKNIKEIEDTVSSIKTDIELLQYKMDEMLGEIKRLDIIEIDDTNTSSDYPSPAPPYEIECTTSEGFTDDDSDNFFII